MLKWLKLRHVGPSDEVDLQCASRLNLISGDNSLGKSFLLDLGWWALTRTWAGELAQPNRGHHEDAEIGFSIQSANNKAVEHVSKFDRSTFQWAGRAGRPWSPGFVVYARADGGFSVWDPARNYWKTKFDDPDRPAAYHFSSDDVWNGLSIKDERVCNGLIVDWVQWQLLGNGAAQAMATAVKILSEDRDTLSVGEPRRVSPYDPRLIPTISTRYSADIPVTQVSSGVKRVLMLAYLTVWAWREHLVACDLTGLDVAKRAIFLVDEIEAHLHPKWQRKILPSLLKLANNLSREGMKKTGQNSLSSIQFFVSTHSPIIFSSIEPIFDEEKDAWFDIDIVRERAGGPAVVLAKKAFEKKGSAERWLLSDAFDLTSTASSEAEKAISQAARFIKTGGKVGKREEIERQLVKYVGQNNPIWSNWLIATKKQSG